MNRRSTKFQTMVLEDETLRSEGIKQVTGEEPLVVQVVLEVMTRLQ